MTQLPPDLYHRCRTLLLRCAEFDTHAALRAVFITTELVAFRDGLPEATNKAALVDATLAYLLHERLTDGRAVLPLFLTTLAERRDPSIALSGELAALAQEIGGPHAAAPRFRSTTGPADSALRMAQRALAILEQQVAGFGALHVPVHLQIELEEKRRQVAELEARLGGTRLDVPPVSPVPGVSTATLRCRLSALDDVQLDTLCMDHFPTVYDRFSRGLRRDEKLNVLLDYCRRNPEAAARLDTLLGTR